MSCLNMDFRTIKMNIDDLKALIEQKESQTLEFKKSTSLLKTVFQTVCGFLNGSGGTVLIGVTDRGKIIGQEVSDSTKKEIAREISKFEPPIQVLITYVPVDHGKEVIVLTVKKGPYAPYVFDSRPYQRSQSTTSKMSQHQYEQLLVERSQLNYAWDEMLSTGYEIDDLDHEEIRRTVLQGVTANRISQHALNESIPNILKRLNLLRDERLTNAAILLFCKKVGPEYPQFHIKMARFKGITKTGAFIDNQSFYGNAFEVLSEASEFVRRHLPIASFYQENSFERVDLPALPVLAVREAIINAICHRDYADRMSYIAIAIYDDRLEIWSYGLLVSIITIADLKHEHKSHSRNSLVSNIFYLRNLVEKWGTGTNKMIDLCRDQDLQAPEFKEYSGGFAVIFKFKELIGSSIKTEPMTDKLTPRQNEIFDILEAEGPLTFQNIKIRLKTNVPERTLRRDLLAMTEIGVLGSKGQTNVRVWFVLKK